MCCPTVTIVTIALAPSDPHPPPPLFVISPDFSFSAREHSPKHSPRAFAEGIRRGTRGARQSRHIVAGLCCGCSVRPALGGSYSDWFATSARVHWTLTSSPIIWNADHGSCASAGRYQHRALATRGVVWRLCSSRGTFVPHASMPSHSLEQYSLVLSAAPHALRAAGCASSRRFSCLQYEAQMVRLSCREDTRLARLCAAMFANGRRHLHLWLGATLLGGIATKAKLSAGAVCLSFCPVVRVGVVTWSVVRAGPLWRSARTRAPRTSPGVWSRSAPAGGAQATGERSHRHRASAPGLGALDWHALSSTSNSA